LIEAESEINIPSMMILDMRKSIETKIQLQAAVIGSSFLSFDFEW